MYSENRPFRTLSSEELKELSQKAMLDGNKVIVNQVYAEMGYRR